MKIIFALGAFAVASVSAFDDNTGKIGTIDTTRASRTFNPPKTPRAGYTFATEIKIGIAAEMDTMGMDLQGTFDAVGDTEMSVTEGGNGRTKTELEVKNVAAELATPLLSFQCDSNDQANSDATCEALFDVVGASETLVLDEYGNLVEMTTPDGVTYNIAAMQAQQTLEAKFEANQWAASQHFDKSQQFLELIPNHPVAPGASWRDDVSFDEYGRFKGISKLVGYTNYAGADCALFRFDGSVHLSLEIIASAIGVDMKDMPSNLKDTVVTNDILYDVDDDVIRWVEVNLTTSFDIANPMDPTAAPGSAHIPLTVSFSFATDILARPAPNDLATPGASESNYRASSSSYAKAPEPKTSKGGGAFKGIFFALLVGVAAAGGFVYFKKQQEGWEFIRPTYELSAFGSEPIYNSPPLV